MKIKNLTKETILVENLILAHNFYTRLKGLIGKSTFNDGEGLHIKPCNSIHMFFMKITIDVVFLDNNYNVISLKENVKPWSYINPVRRSTSVLELPVNTISKKNLSLGDKLKFL